MTYFPLYLTTDTVPYVFSRNHCGFFFRLMITTSNGIFLVNNTRMVRCANGQNLMLRTVTLSWSACGSGSSSPRWGISQIGDNIVRHWCAMAQLACLISTLHSSVPH